MPDKVFGAELMEYLDRKRGGFLGHLENEVPVLEAYARANRPWTDRTGHAKNGIFGKAAQVRRDLWRLSLGHTMEYGPYLELGTPPHIIRPKNKKLLAWQSSGDAEKTIVAKEVHHPGTRPRPIIRPTLMAHLDGIKQGVVAYWRDEKK
ncbi:MAG: hypothetical protein PHT33_11555 [bacterium]|nr:hypothetical protein [bacterium]